MKQIIDNNNNHNKSLKNDNNNNHDKSLKNDEKSFTFAHAAHCQNHTIQSMDRVFGLQPHHIFLTCV